jgi:hypothetical protein
VKKREKTGLDWWDEKKKKYFIDMGMRMCIVVEDHNRQIGDVYLDG